jgi:MoxR-like ATPase
MKAISFPSTSSATRGSLGQTLVDSFLKASGSVIFNKEHEFKLSLTCFLAQGHFLIEDIPGVGKTTFVKTLSRLLGLPFGRIQFTNDLLPSDIVGTSIYDQAEKKFRFHPGPIFSQLVLIDELNRATPKTYSLPDPFFLVATQNPRFQLGTFSLPESQLDRFMMRIQLGYPGAGAEKALLMDGERDRPYEKLDPVLPLNELLALRKEVAKVHVSEALADYVQKILEQSRSQQKDVVGLSPRAGLSLVAAARAWAFLDGRNMVLPEDVQAVSAAVINHRISGSEATYKASAALAEDLVRSVEIT